MGIYPHVLTRHNDLAVANRIYVPNLAGQSHRAAIPEARRPQRLPHTDLYAAASVFGVPHFPLVLGALLRLVEHPPNATAEAAGYPGTCSYPAVLWR